MPSGRKAVAKGPPRKLLGPGYGLGQVEDASMNGPGLSGFQDTLLGLIVPEGFPRGAEARPDPAPRGAHGGAPGKAPTRRDAARREHGFPGRIADLQHPLQERHRTDAPGMAAGVGALRDEHV